MSLNRPSEMDRDTFVAEFGGIFEHSPWIADGAYDLELGQHMIPHRVSIRCWRGFSAAQMLTNDWAS